ncbi:AI-2E family transporter [Marivirga sp.]|uniref:AI-2E family transporter n=1 Tax=Marivirga sp. TaxID=2018662 RepID=UPI002D7EC778|nr:AI-2E family transporter [Marivirga sp.]HET8859468.1 AI-2E family transporter [Marivirga sp.]
MIIIIAGISILWIGKPVIIPLAAGLLLSFILLPVVNFLEKKSFPKFLAILITILTLLSIVGTVIFLYSNQIIKIIDQFGSFQNQLIDTVSKIVEAINKNLDLKEDLKTPEVMNKAKDVVENNKYLPQVIGSLLKSLGNILLFLVFTILFLNYRKGLLKAVKNFGRSEETKKNIGKAIIEASKVGRNYVLGNLLLIIILTTINTTGLLIIGIDYPLFFGFLPALFCIIPYIGSLMGASIVLLFTIFNYDSLVYPVSVAGLFWLSQLLESNVLNPKIVGGNLKLNVLFVIISLMIGQLIWGIAGLILSVPMMAIFKVFCNHFEPLKPVSLLIGTEVHTDPGENNERLFLKVKRFFSKSEKKG